MKIRKPFNVETFKSESAQIINIQMGLQDLHSEIAGRNNVNAYMVSLPLSNYVNDICDYLIELQEKDYKGEKRKKKKKKKNRKIKKEEENES